MNISHQTKTRGMFSCKSSPTGSQNAHSPSSMILCKSSDGEEVPMERDRSLSWLQLIYQKTYNCPDMAGEPSRGLKKALTHEISKFGGFIFTAGVVTLATFLLLQPTEPAPPVGRLHMLCVLKGYISLQLSARLLAAGALRLVLKVTSEA